MSWEIFDEKYEDYDRWFEERGKIVYLSELKAIKSVLKEQKQKLLEIGVGTGRFAVPLNINYGLEPSQKMAKMSKKRGICVTRGRAEELPFKNNSFDTAFLIVTVCFVDDLKKSISEVYRVLKDGGEIIIGFVPSESSWGKMYLKKKREGHPYYKYANFYSFSTLKDKIEKAGFKILLIVSTLTKPPDKIKDIMPFFSGYKKEAGFIIIKAQKN